MPAATMAWLAPTVLGGLGIWQASESQKKQQDAIKKAQKSGKWTEAAQARMFGLAENYDPVKSGEIAIDRADEVAGANLERTLKSVRGDFVSQGGDPTGDTAFNVRAQTGVNRVLDPLREMIARIRAGADMQKMGAYQAVAGVPIGQVSQNYWQSAAANQPNWAAPAQMLSQAIRGIGGPKGGAGGSGDGRVGSVGGDIQNSNWLWGGTG